MKGQVKPENRASDCFRKQEFQFQSGRENEVEVTLEAEFLIAVYSEIGDQPAEQA